MEILEILFQQFFLIKEYPELISFFATSSRWKQETQLWNFIPHFERAITLFQSSPIRLKTIANHALSLNFETFLWRAISRF